MDWRKWVGMGGEPEPEKKPEAAQSAPAQPAPAQSAPAQPAPARKGSRAKQTAEQYKEVVGLMHQLVVEGLNHGAKTNAQLHTLNLLDQEQDPATFRNSQSKGPIIEMRVAGKPEAKLLQYIVRKAMGYPEQAGYNPLMRVEGSRTNENGEPTYKLYLPVAEFFDDRYVEKEFSSGDGRTMKRLTAPVAKELLEKSLLYIGQTPNPTRYYRDKKSVAGEEELEETIRRDSIQARKEGRDDRTDAERASSGRWVLKEDGTIERPGQGGGRSSP